MDIAESTNWFIRIYRGTCRLVGARTMVLPSDAMPFGEIKAAAALLGNHPQDHGWREFFRLIHRALDEPSPALREVIALSVAQQPSHAASHLINLLGIAIKSLDARRFDELSRPTDVPPRLAMLQELLQEHRAEVVAIISRRRNSFTATRRFLLPQVLLSAFFARHHVPDMCFADFGTGLGIMPRQLNSERLYSMFCTELSWPGGIPRFRTVPVRRTIGVDRGPLPDLAWVRACYGSSNYYTKLWEELLFTLDVLAEERATTEFYELDLLDVSSLTAFLRDNPVHAANLCYVLYEIEPGQREKIIHTLLEGLRPPGIIIVTEPRGELSRQGCDVVVHCQDRSTPYRLCTVSDGHFTGQATPLPDYAEFTAKYPIICD